MIKTLKIEIEEELTNYYNTTVNIKSVQSLGGGCINNASKLITNEGNFFLKWSNNLTQDIYLREAESLEELKKAADEYIEIPTVIKAKKIEDAYGYLLLSFINEGNNNRSQEQLGRGLAKIHQYHKNQFGFYHDNYCGATTQNNSWCDEWVTFYGEQRVWFLVKKLIRQKKLTTAEIKIYERLVSNLQRFLPNNPKPNLIHGDLWSGNFMQTKNGFALIDPACSYSDRELEFGITTLFGGFSNRRFWDAYNENYPLTDNWQERNRLYQLYHLLNHYYLFGGGYGAQALNIAKRFQ